VKLEKAQSDIVEMAHTAMGHMEVLKKKVLVLAVPAMSQEEFDQLVAAGNEATAAVVVGGILGTVGEHDSRTDENVSIFKGESGAANVSIETMSEGVAEAV
jgi:hypothetical protein